MLINISSVALQQQQITSYSFSYGDWYSVLHLSQLDLPIISVNKASIIKELSLFFPQGFFQ